MAPFHVDQDADDGLVVINFPLKLVTTSYILWMNQLIDFFMYLKNIISATDQYLSDLQYMEL